MANWDKLTGRGNVTDRRSLGAVGGSLGIGGIVLILALTYLTGGSVTDVLPEITQNLLVEQDPDFDPSVFEGADQYEVFVSTVLGSNNDMWSSLFAKNDMTYTPPHLVLFRGATQSACGGASAQVGPHYCPLDSTIYLDETFFDELQRRFGAQGGDVAEAYVIAHEVAHHAQYELGLAENAERSNEDSIALELQADCFAGLWAHSIKDRGVFEPGEIKEALDAAAAVGDDRIQEAVTGRVNPESWTHGSSEQRVSWFNRGYESGDLSQCNT
jgi:predicted metalloprotease